MDCAELYIAIATLLSSLAALGVAYASLRIAKQVAILNSGSFRPRFYINFLEDGIEVQNKDANLYDIQMVSIVVIQHIGIDLYVSAVPIDIPLVLHSRCFGNTYNYNGVKRKKKIQYNHCDKLRYEDGDTEIALREMPQTLIHNVKAIIDSKYGLNAENRNGYASPAMNYTESLVSIDYLTKHNEAKHYYLYRRGEGYGIGELRWELTEDEFDQHLTRNSIPIFEDAKDFIAYCIEHKRIEL